MKHVSDSPEQTQAIAADLAADLGPGQCVALFGDLGAGKTQFVRGLVRGLGGPERIVSSPTFVLLHVYPGGRLTVYHLDAYRLASGADLLSIDLSELMDQAGLVVIEWAQNVADLLPPSRVNVRLQTLDIHRRRIDIDKPSAPARPV